jgi:BTB/POZ domain
MSGVVRFNVGGREFATSMSTLGDENNMLATMARRHVDGSLPSVDIGGALFIDRDPDCFGAVLNFLRTGKLFPPPGVSRGQLREEMEFYGLSEGVGGSSNGSSGVSAAGNSGGGKAEKLIRSWRASSTAWSASASVRRRRLSSLRVNAVFLDQ